MTYDAYVEKMRKTARRIAFVKRHKLAFGALAAVVLAAILVLMFCSGTFFGGAYSDNTVYGDRPSYGAAAFLSFPDYRFARTGSDDWTENYPEKIGSYEMIAETRNPFGTVRQVGSHFEISKRNAKITLPDTTLFYGDSASVLESRLRVSNLAEGDRLVDVRLSVSGELRVSGPVEIQEFRIVNQKGTDVTDCYDWTVESGYLTVVKRRMTLRANSDQKVYDGTPLQNSGWTVESGSLREGDRLDVTVRGTITQPGMETNSISARVLDKNGNDVTDTYDLTLLIGTLTVNPRPITVKTDSAQKQYDRHPLSATGYNVTAGSLLPGHRLVIDGVTSIVDAGNATNILRFSVQDQMGTDFSHCYHITQNSGVLTITPIELSFTTGSAEKVYDGAPLVCNQYSQIGGQLLKGDTMSLTFRELTNAGTVDNIFICTILDPNGGDVTKNYRITAKWGKLTVKRREITIQTDTAEKPYDGTPLYSLGYVLLKGTLADPNTTFRALTYAKQTQVGSRVNVVSFGLYLPNGEAVNSNYAITYVNGTLTVKESGYVPPVTTPGTSPGTTPGSTPGSVPGTFPGGLPGTLPEGVPPLSEIPGIGDLSGDIPNVGELPPYLGPLGNLLVEQSGSYYLRMTCFGDYLGGGRWGMPNLYTEKSAKEQSPLETAAFWLTTWYDYPLLPGTVTLYTNPGYDLLPALGLDVDYPNDCYKPWSHEVGTGYPVNFLSQVELEEILKVWYYEEKLEDSDYCQYVYANYLTVPDDLRWEFVNLVARNNFFTISDEMEKILAVQSYIRGCASYNLFYNACPQGVDPVIYFLTESREGVCVHFASAAVLMYRTLGIPARMAGGFMVDAKGGSLTTFNALNAHAWVEIYLSGFGWVPVEVTGDGFITQENPLVVVPDSGEKIYDGTPLVAEGYEILSGTLLEGDYIVAKVGGSQLFAGTSPSFFEIFEIHDSSGRDVTQEYDLILPEGTLTVKPLEIGLNPDQLTVYLGTDVTVLPIGCLLKEELPLILVGMSPTIRIDCPGAKADREDDHLIHTFMVSKGKIIYEYDLNEDGIPEGQGILKLAIESFTSVTVVDKNAADALATGEVENAGLFEPITVKGPDGNDYLALSIAMGDASGRYNGTPLTCSDFRLLAGALREGDQIVVRSGSYQLYVGSSDNVCGSLVVLDDQGKDVTRLYSITVYSGKLTVTPGELPLARRTLTVPVDGELELSQVAWSENLGAFPAGYQLSNADGTVRLEGSRLFGIRQGSAILVMNCTPWDLNGDGVPEYEAASYSYPVRVSQREEHPIPVLLWVSLGVFVGSCVLAAFILRRRYRKR